MKKLILAGFIPILLAALLTASVGAAGTQDDPLISLSYLNGDYKTKLITDATTETDKILSAAFDAAVLKLGGGTAGYAFAPRFTEVYITKGKTVGLTSGGSFILTSGTAAISITRGTVIDVSTGNVIGTGAQATPAHRYFCAEDTDMTVTAATSALVQVDGYYKTDGLVSVKTVFKDVALTAWYYDAVDYVYSSNLFTGTSEDTFAPELAMTRAMFVTVLHRLDGRPATSGQSVFSDVADPEQYYYTAVIWASANGIVTGYDDGTFLPTRAITREQMAAIMYRYAVYSGKNTNANSSAFDAFPDKGTVSPYAVEPIKWATSLGIINGSNGWLLPGHTATRAQVAQIILNFNEKAG